jgi:hypothetical protein
MAHTQSNCVFLSALSRALSILKMRLIMSMSILKCNCSDTPAAKYQDTKYGKGMRVCNHNQKKGAKCTVCGTIHKVS